jgi:predicted metal-dependent hydrolase
MINLLRGLQALRHVPKLAPKVITINDVDVVLTFRRNAQCRRMVLRLTPDGSGVVMTLPPRASEASAMRFAESSKDWIAKTMDARAPVVSLSDGQSVLYRGELHAIKAIGGKRGVVAIESKDIVVPGDAAHVPRRLQDWLKVQAKRELIQASHFYAAAMDVKFQRLTLRDQHTRWGSCSSGGDLSYSWRLILAPPHVLDYVAAHEVAHLKEMNHGPRFWRLVLAHCKSAKESRNWLRLNGRELHRYQIKAL